MLISRRGLLAGSAAATVAGLGRAGAQPAASYLIATGPPGGAALPAGIAIATLCRIRLGPLNGISAATIASGSGPASAALLSEDAVQLAILLGLTGADAGAGSGPFAVGGPLAGLRSIAALWPEVQHLVLRRGLADRGTVGDLLRLDGPRLAIGRRGTQEERANRQILQAIGIDDPEIRFDIADLDHRPAAELFLRGELDALNLPAAPPDARLQRLLAEGEAALLSWSEAEIAALAGSSRGVWRPYTLAGGSYPEVPGATATVAQSAFLATNARVREEHAYLITRALMENAAFLAGVHPPLRNIGPQVALAGLTLPLHPGAARYYEETGLTVPPTLRL